MTTKHVLVLGAGLVSRPLVRYLLDQPDIHVTVASRTLSKAQVLLEGRPNGRALALDAGDIGAVEEAISACDLAISLLPYVHHTAVARLCVAHRKHLVTTSYVQAAMRELDAPAREAGVLLLNEIGLDPGIDHMLAMRLIHAVQREGGHIISFLSYCGGLPAPEANTNPLGYKFSWSPRGVLLATRNPARFMRDGHIVELSAEQLFDHCWTVSVPELGDFEAYPNRDSLPYLDLYGIRRAREILRATLRYKGWCATVKCLRRLGLLTDQEYPDLGSLTWAQLLARLIGATGRAPIREEVAAALGLDAGAAEMERLAWLGLFEEQPVPAGARTPLDALVAQMWAKMQYEPHERDMIILKHEFIAAYADHSEHITATMIEFGIPGGDSAMARTVGLPAAIASRLILEGAIPLAGVQIPVHPSIYEPVLDELAARGISCKETRRRL